MIMIYSGSRADYSIAYWVNEALNKIGIDSWVDEYYRDKPDYIILIGDRKEVAEKAIEAVYNQTPIIHIGGGEVSQGSYDDIYRDMITASAKYHFVISDKCAERLIDKGIDKHKIFVVGSPRVDYVKHIEIKPIKRKAITGLVIYHPETKEFNLINVYKFFGILKELGTIKFIVLPPNKDNYSVEVQKVIRDLSSGNIECIDEMDQEKYIETLASVDFMIGNSSAGIMETSIFKLPNICVGSRQDGRDKYNNTIDVGYNEDEIMLAIKKAISVEFKSQIKTDIFDGMASERIANIIKEL